MRPSPARHTQSRPGEMTYCAYYKLAYYCAIPTKILAMPQPPIKREFAFTIMDVARLLKTYADQRARQFGISRAQWAVLIRIDRSEGLKQTELADMLDLQPITLTRLLDRLSDLGADMMEIVLDGLSATSIERMLKELSAVKDNLRSAIAGNANQQQAATG